MKNIFKWAGIIAGSLIGLIGIVYIGSENANFLKTETPVETETETAAPTDTETKEVIYYNSAEELEEALNSGEDVTDAMVTFNAGIITPGPNGYILNAGKKLAFISANHPNVEPGSAVTVKVKSFEENGGVWNIKYEK